MNPSSPSVHSPTVRQVWIESVRNGSIYAGLLDSGTGGLTDSWTGLSSSAVQAVCSIRLRKQHELGELSEAEYIHNHGEIKAVLKQLVASHHPARAAGRTG